MSTFHFSIQQVNYKIECINSKNYLLPTMLFVRLVIRQSELFFLNLRLNTFGFLSRILSLFNDFPSYLLNVPCELDLANKKKKTKKTEFYQINFLKTILSIMILDSNILLFFL